MAGNQKDQAALTNNNNFSKCFNKSAVTICFYGNAAILFFLGVYFFIIPFFMMIYYLADPKLKDDRIPRLAFSLHRSLSPKYEKWARHRVSSGQAENLDIENISGTEWPIFGSMFYLLATESLQDTWEEKNKLSRTAPKVYAEGAIKAAAELVSDPIHATWVKEHWGENYLHRENVFYRMLLISAFTSYQKLLGDKKYQDFLKDQVETLSKELDESPYGLLDDYPGQCYPTDVVAAIAAISRADKVLGTDHSVFIKRSIRAFQGKFVDSTGLPPYQAYASSGIIDIARGCSSQWITVWAPQLWPEYSKQLYKNFETHFWQKKWGVAGFREFTKNSPEGEWYFDVDSGPVMAGFGAAASAFGIGAARANGRFDHAYPLTAEAIVISWPLLNGTLAGPRVLSNAVDAPYLGEAAMLFALTRMPVKGAEIVTGGKIPIFVYLALLIYLLIGAVWIIAGLKVLRWGKRWIFEKHFPLEKIQIIVWLALVVTGIVMFGIYHSAFGLLFILFAQFLPRGKREIIRL